MKKLLKKISKKTHINNACPSHLKNHHRKRMGQKFFFFLINTLIEGQLRDIARESGVFDSVTYDNKI